MIHGHFEAFQIFFLSLIFPFSISGPTHCSQNKILPALIKYSLVWLLKASFAIVHDKSIQPNPPRTCHSVYSLHPLHYHLLGTACGRLTSNKRCSAMLTLRQHKILAMHSGSKIKFIESILLDSRCLGLYDGSVSEQFKIKALLHYPWSN